MSDEIQQIRKWAEWAQYRIESGQLRKGREYQLKPRIRDNLTLLERIDELEAENEKLRAKGDE